MAYWSGDGVPQDYSQAVTWLRKAADGGYGEAQSGLAAAYFLGLGAPKDPVEALKWLTLASSSALLDNPMQLESAKKSAASLAQSLTPAQVEEAHKRAGEWKAAFEKQKK